MYPKASLTKKNMTTNQTVRIIISAAENGNCQIRQET